MDHYHDSAITITWDRYHPRLIRKLYDTAIILYRYHDSGARRSNTGAARCTTGVWATHMKSWGLALPQTVFFREKRALSAPASGNA